MLEVYHYMQITNQNNRINFTSTPLHFVNLRNADNTFTKAVFSRLGPEDIKVVEELKDSWAVPHGLMKDFYTDFLRQSADNEFHAIELIEEGSLAKKIIGVVFSSIDRYGKENYVNMQSLVTKPELAAANKKRSLKGIGEVLLGEAFNLAKKANASDFSFTSAAYTFYKKTFKDAGIEIRRFQNYDPYNDRYCLHKDTFDKYINYCQDKYKTNFSATI